MTLINLKRFIPIGFLAVLSSSAVAQAEGQFLGWPEGQTLPSFAAPADTLEYLDLEKSHEDERNLLTSLAGLVNRVQPRIYTISGNPDEGKLTWLKNAALAYRKVADPYSLIVKYRGSAKGLVITDPQQPATLNLATTIAGLEDLLVVSPSLAVKLNAAPYNLPTRQDLRGQFRSSLQVYQTLYRKYWPRATHRLLVGLDPATSGFLRDYAVATRAAVVWLNARDPIENGLLRLFLRDLPASAPYLGWFPYAEGGGEQVGVDQLSSFGLVAVASNYSENLTVFGGQNRTIQVRPAPTKPALENKIYLTLMISEGDNIQYDQHYLRKLWDDPKRGKIPIGWTISPLLRDAAPALLNYYYASASDNDTLISGPSGAGYAYPNAMPSEQLDTYTSRTDQYMGATGLEVITLWQTNSGVPSNETGQAYARHSTHILGITNQISSGLRWYDQLANFGLNASYVESAFQLDNAFRLGGSGFDGKAPRFVGVQGLAWKVSPTVLYDAWRPYAKDSRYVLVRPDHFFLLLQEAKKSGVIK